LPSPSVRPQAPLCLWTPRQYTNVFVLFFQLTKVTTLPSQCFDTVGWTSERASIL